MSVDYCTSNPGKTVNTECGTSVICKLQNKPFKTLFKTERALIQRELVCDSVVKKKKNSPEECIVPTCCMSAVEDT